MTNDTLKITDDTITTESRTINLPPFEGDCPVNYHHFRESIALAMISEGISEETLTEILKTTDQAVTNNEHSLMWGNEVPLPNHDN